MERVAFLLDSGRRLDCLLNPESLTITRSAGVQPRHTRRGPVAIAGGSDDAMLFTGGGATVLHLDLLFDVTISGSSTRTDDVRDLTGPIRDLAENAKRDTGRHAPRPPIATFVWGKAWNVSGIVTDVAERLESFSARGVPSRSWLRMRFQRVHVDRRSPTTRTHSPSRRSPSLVTSAWSSTENSKPAATSAHQVLGSGGRGERLDQIAAQHLGDPARWRELADANDIADPLRMPVGTILAIPLASELDTNVQSHPGRAAGVASTLPDDTPHISLCNCEDGGSP